MIALIFCLILTIFAIQTAGQCSGNNNLRLEWNQLSPDLKGRYVSALQTMHGRGIIDRLTRYHLSNTNTWHNTPLFLFAHRHYMLVFERELKAIDSGLSAHYWDWSSESSNWQQSDLWRYLGGSGATQCLNIGFQWIVANPRRHCVTRRFSEGSLTPVPVLQRLLGDSDFFAFAERFEYGPHAQTHFAVGGDFATMASPNDPLFYLHHAFVDKVLSDWMLRHGSNFPQTFLNEAVPNSPVTVRDLIRPCYTYSQNIPGVEQINSVPTLKYPIHVSDDFILHMNYSVRVMRNVEEELRHSFVNVSQQILMQQGS